MRLCVHKTLAVPIDLIMRQNDCFDDEENTGHKYHLSLPNAPTHSDTQGIDCTSPKFEMEIDNDNMCVCVCVCVCVCACVAVTHRAW